MPLSVRHERQSRRRSEEGSQSRRRRQSKFDRQSSFGAPLRARGGARAKIEDAPSTPTAATTQRRQPAYFVELQSSSVTVVVEIEVTVKQRA